MITPDELNLLIEQTYKVEKEFNELKNSYNSLEETVKNIVEFLPNGIWIFNDDGSIFLQNSQAKKLSNLVEFLKFSDEDYEINIDNKSYLIKSSKYEDKIMFSATDITEQKRKENLATMGQMAAHLSHEIRNPIGSISLLTSTLKNKVIKENIPIVEEIQKAVFRIDRIIKSTLMFSKGIQANKEPFLWKDLEKSIKEAINYYGWTKDIKFIYPNEMFILNADKDLLEMMFVNFITNAIDAIELSDDENGIIEISYKNDGEFHIFEIYDSGIPIENKNELFEAFKSTKVKGNGLGLILSKQIAEVHGGDVTLLNSNKKIFQIKIKI